MKHTTIIRALAIVSVTTAMLAVFTDLSFAHTAYLPSGKFGSAGSGAGQFNTPVGVAVDESNGDVYVVDKGNNRVERFEADGTYLSELAGGETPAKAFAEPTYVAVDNSADAAKGHVYVADPSQEVVDAFDSTGKYLFQIKIEALIAITTDTQGHLWVWTNQTSFEEYSETGELILRHEVGRGKEAGIVVDSKGNVYVLYGSDCIGRYSPPAFEENNEAHVCGGVTLAIDPATDNIFQDNQSSIAEWPPFGEGPGLWERTQELISGGFNNSHGLTVNGTTGVLYVSDETANDVEALEAVVVPDVTTIAASAIAASTATIDGTVNPVGIKTSYYFEWGGTTAYGHSTPIETAGEGETTLPVSADLTGLEANTTYHYRIVASNEAGASRGQDDTFTTLPLPPTIEGPPAALNMTRSSAVIHTTVDAERSDTTFHILYVEAATYEPTATNPYEAGGSTQPSSVSVGAGGQEVEQLVSGLKPGTTYHYEVVAVNKAGRVTSADSTFATGSATPPVAVTGGSAGIVENAATISGVVDTSGLPSTYGFEVATSTDYGPPTGLGSVGAGLHEASVSLTLTGLLPGTTYHYRLTVTNLDGTSYGEDRAFTTGVFASTFAVPPAPLPFVSVPSFAFPSEAPSTVVKKKAKAKTKKKPKKHGKAKDKKQPKKKK